VRRAGDRRGQGGGRPAGVCGTLKAAPVGKSLTLAAALFLGAALLVAGACRPAAEPLLMGTTFQIRALVEDEEAGCDAIEAAFAEIERVEALLSEWIDASEISAVNAAAGVEPVAVGPELLEVVERAQRIGALTGGAFDATFVACGRLWSFTGPRRPDDDELAACLELVDGARVELDAEASTVFLPERGMALGISGIGKGYGVDVAAGALEERGVTDYFVDGGGDIRLRVERRGEPWRVGIAHPRSPGNLLGTLALEDGAVVSSGDYFQYFERDGVRYHHILDPSTGRPADLSIAVTVIAPEATDADALATGIFVLGPERGLALVETLPGVEALIVVPGVELHRSSGFPELER
jgi:thiamine biosynthesis lipoprotein